MSEAPWAGVITADDEARYEAAGFGGPAGNGRRSALLIIDVQYRTVGDTPKPFFEAVQDYPTACGDVGWAAVERIGRLLATFRESSLPVLYPHVAPKESYDAGRLAAKVPSIMEVPEKGYRFVDAVAPEPARSSFPSATRAHSSPRRSPAI
jgi:nicotinamidase-related amidase